MLELQLHATFAMLTPSLVFRCLVIK
jgi:hypothetical protein